MDYRLPAGTFLQVNPDVASALAGALQQVIGTAPATLWDLFGGVGAHGLPWARQGSAVTVVDADQAAIRCAKGAARHAGLSRVEAIHAQVEPFLESIERVPELMLINPPRSGMGKSVARRLSRLLVPRVVCIACDPATLARDLRPFVDAGYAIERVMPFDMFPQTAHVETVLTMRRLDR